MSRLNEVLAEVIVEEISYQAQANENESDKYRHQARYHTELMDEFGKLAKDYPHFILELLTQHINKEDKIFGIEVTAPVLTPQEEGRIYSLVRCKHMIRIAKERAGV